VLSTLATAAVTTAAPAAVRAPIRDCGDVGVSTNGDPYAITAQGARLPCTTARAVARAAAAKRSCRTSGSCVVRGFTCLVGKAGTELYLVHCEASNQTRLVRFEFGS
jgi:3-dehydroquinate synthase class II